MRKGKQKQQMLQLVSNTKARRRKFEKRNKSLQKAATELSTLCGVDIGMIVFGPDQLAAWNEQVLAGLTEAYKAKRVCAKPYNLPDFYKDETEKMKRDVDRLRFKKLKFDSPEESKQFGDALMAKIAAVRTRINEKRFPNSYYHNPAQGSVWNYDQVQQPTNFVYYNDHIDNNNQMMMMGYYDDGAGASNYNGMYTSCSSNYAAYGSASSSNGTYGTGMMTTTYNNDEMMGSCYYMPNIHDEEQQKLALEWASSMNPDGQKLLDPAAEWFLKEESSW